MSWLTVIGGFVTLALLLTKFFIQPNRERRKDAKEAFKGGVDALKNRDESAFNFSVQCLNRMLDEK